MITLKEWMELVDYKITEGSEYCWQCYGDNAYCLDSWNGAHDGHSFTIVFDKQTQEVFEVQAHDFLHSRAYRMINPEYKSQQAREVADRNCGDEAWGQVEYVDLEVDDDFIQKCLAIRDGEDYDTRVSVPVDFTDEELLKYMKLAHERDMTFNQFVEEALLQAIESYKRDLEGTKDKVKQWVANHD
jgi:hypothetical protein